MIAAAALVQLEDRLRSRFAHGMIADIQAADLGRARLFCKLRPQRGQVLPLDVVDYWLPRAAEYSRAGGALSSCWLSAIAHTSHAGLATNAGRPSPRQTAVKPLQPQSLSSTACHYFDLQT